MGHGAWGTAMTLMNGATSRPWPGEASGEATVEAMAAAK